MSVSRFRQRGKLYYPNHGVIGTGYSWDSNRKVWFNPQYYYANYSGCLKEWTRCWDETHPGPPWREGGPLMLLREQGEPTTRICSGDRVVPNQMKYVGDFHFMPFANYDTVLSGMSDHTAANYGSTAWKALRPVQPSASGNVFLVELREFLDLFKFKLRGYKALGNNYLNYKFGWTPFLGDLGRFIRTQDAIENLIATIRRNNGKWIKRRRTISDTVKSVTTSNQGNRIYPTLPTPFYGSIPLSSCELVKIETDRIWCEAQMKYYIPKLEFDLAKDIWSSELRRRIFGLDISPALVWELVPWSWLFDWFTNIGDVFRAISGQSYDNLVAKYAYVMRHRRIYYMYSQIQNFAYGEPVRLRKSFTVECKEREGASPFGFGLEIPDDLTVSQLAILAALGITRFL